MSPPAFRVSTSEPESMAMSPAVVRLPFWACRLIAALPVSRLPLTVILSAAARFSALPATFPFAPLVLMP
ncbi:hypothetical protein, partial [Methylobacter sp. BlB1]|uniref:hypothetical protein n=1 Tax=Methylobacter sp. BlB1 TaxID=2785914 RepID=UPI001892FBA6